MRWSWLKRLVDRVARIGAHPAETEEERVRRQIWVIALAAGAIPVSVLVTFIFSVLGSAPAAILSALGAAFWTSQLLLAGLLRRGVDAMALASQLSCVVFSCASVLAMGGLPSSGGMVLIGLIGPLYALAFPSRRRAWWMLGAYLASLGVGVAVGDRVPWARPLPEFANVVVFALMVITTAATVFGALYFFVLQRDRALRLLREAEDRISTLLQSSPRASDTIPAWSTSLARDIAGAIGAERIGVWEMGTDRLVPLAAEGLDPPPVGDLQDLSLAPSGTFTQTPQGTLVAVHGTSGELCGALVVSGGSLRWTQTERRLVSGFAHQLGAALDMNRMRLQLAAADQRRALSRQEMHERGIATLQTCPRCGRCYDHTAGACSDDGSALVSPRTLPYRLLDRYCFTRVLGEGGMGIVVAAWDERLLRDVAVKLIRPEHFNNPDLRQRFDREARTVARIQHPGVIALYDSGELDEGTAFLVMEKLTGCDLASQIQAHGRGTPAQVAELVRQGCAALRAAHRAGVVHRDVKPENIFLVDDPAGFRLKVLDFGLAKSMTFERGLTQTGMVMGTPTYMSPEQVQGEDVDARTDVYSFAAVCYEALTGRKIVSGDDLGRILISVLNTVPAPPSSFVPGLPPEVDAAFASALAKDRSRRLKEIELWGSSFVESLAVVAPDAATTGWPFPREAQTAREDASPSEGVTIVTDATRLTPPAGGEAHAAAPRKPDA
jgi:tRNA A-37 threonylcarbamoyl transferase component Bud32